MLLVGCASKKRVEELAAEVKRNQEEIIQLKAAQQVILEGVNKIVLDTKRLGELEGKIDSENKKQFEVYSQKLNELEKGLSATQKGYLAKLDSIANGETSPASKAANTTAKAEISSSDKNQAAATQKAYVLSGTKNNSSAQWDLYMFKKMLIPGTSQEKVVEVMGSPDQQSDYGGWIYFNKVRDKVTFKSLYLRIKFSAEGVESVESQ